VDTDTVGEYTMTYTVTDSNGNTGTATRTVQVVSRGAVVSVTALENNQVLVGYTDGSSQTFTAFSSGTAIPRVRLSTDGARVLVLKRNGRRLVVLDATLGIELDSIRIAKRKQKLAKFKVFDFYSDASDEVMIATKRKKVLRVFGVLLTSGNVLEQRNVRRTEQVKATQFKITKKNQRVLVKKQSGKRIVRYHVTDTAQLELVD
jgi:hypothetical protein